MSNVYATLLFIDLKRIRNTQNEKEVIHMTLLLILQIVLVTIQIIKELSEGE